MEGFLNSLREAHAEVMEQTGWGDAFDSLGELLSSGPEVAKSFLEDARFFAFAVNWRDPFFCYLGAFHLAVLALVVYLVFWRWQPPRPRPAGVSRAMELAVTNAEEKLFGLSIVLLVLSFMAYPLNKLGLKYGDALFAASGVNYFDDSAIFIGIVYWLPLVLVSLLVQLKLILNVVRLMVLMKREKLGSSMRQQQQQQQQQTDGQAEQSTATATAASKKRD